MPGDTLAQLAEAKSAGLASLILFPRVPPVDETVRDYMRQISCRLSHNSRPFVRSIAMNCSFGQRLSTSFYSCGSVPRSKGEKGDKDATEEDFSEAMQVEGTALTFSTCLRHFTPITGPCAEVLLVFACAKKLQGSELLVSEHQPQGREILVRLSAL